MAEVFLAQQRGLEGFDRRVAVKRILPHLADTTDFVKMFLGEARLAAQLAHPNIVHIYDFGKVENDYFIAMEYVEGIHAGQVFKHGERESSGPPKATRMSPTQVARIGADAAAALNYAHGLEGSNGKPLGLVHRDVSPANIMISYDGIVKLCDFGIAKAMAASDQLTNPGQVKGKYAYMSPEQTIASPLDGRSDVFSLAICLWELLSGKTIVPRGDAVDAMRMIRDGKLQPIEKAAPHTPLALAKAIGWALQTKREARATASELAQALEAFIKASPELATPMHLAQWVRTSFPRDTSGQHPMLSADGRASPGTSVAPGTNVAPGTVAGTVTPASNLIAASLVSEPDETAETVGLLSSSDLAGISGVTSEERENAAILDELARDLANANRPTMARLASRPPVDVANRTTDRQAAQTALDAAQRAAEEPTAIDRGQHNFMDSGIDSETHFASGALRAPVPSGPTVVPTRPQLLGLRPPTFGHESGLELRPPTLGPETAFGRPATLGPDATGRIHKARRYLVPAVVLLGLMVVTFLIAVAIKGAPAAVTVDAPTVVSMAPDAAGIDARSIDATQIDAHAIEIDAHAIEIDARLIDAPPDPTALLVLRTTPPGATLKVGDQVRTAPTDLALPDGKYTVVAELDGYQPETRQVELERNERVVLEISFTRRIAVPRPAQTGKLIAYTNPYSDVYNGTRKLGQTPFEMDIAVGTYTLQFKNPAHTTMTRVVKILAGKPTRLKFDLR